MTYATILAVLLAMPVYKEDRCAEAEKVAQLQLVAANVRMTRLGKSGVAMLLAWGWHESNYSLRIHRGECHEHECPSGARGPWQNERNKLDEDAWSRLIGIENTGYQVARAAWFVDWSLRECRGDALCAFRLLGATHGKELKGEQARVRDYQAALRML